MTTYHDYLRWMYRGGRPNRLARVQNRASAIAFGAGIWPQRLGVLEVWGRSTGRVISFPVVIADHGGERYLVAMLGNTRTGCATCAPPAGGPCCATADARVSDSKTSRSNNGRRSCADTWRSRPAPVPTSLSTAMPAPTTSIASPRKSPYSASPPHPRHTNRQPETSLEPHRYPVQVPG